MKKYWLAWMWIGCAIINFSAAWLNRDTWWAWTLNTLVGVACIYWAWKSKKDEDRHRQRMKELQEEFDRIIGKY